MAGMVIKTNMSAVRTLNVLNANQSNLTKDLQKVSSGQRINSAGDDASGYGISERMRNRIRGLEQCSRNVRTGYNMLSVAAQAVEQQVNILGKMREIALKASDDTYTQKDRDILAGEADQLFDQLEHIAQETNYNGINLLNRATPDVVTVTNTNRMFADFDPLVTATPNTTIENLFPPPGTPFSGFLHPNGHTADTICSPYYWNNQDGIGNCYTPGGSGYVDVSMTITLDFSGAVSGTFDVNDFDLQGFSIMCDQCEQFVSIVFDAERDVSDSFRQDSANADYPWTGQYIIGIAGATSTDDIEQMFYDGIIAANTAAVAEGRVRDSISNVVTTNTQGGLGVPARDAAIGTTCTYSDSVSTLMVVHDTKISKDANGKVQISQSATAPMFFEGTKGLSLSSTNTQVIAQGLHPWEDLYIQSDTKASQATKIRLWNTTLDVLFPPTNTQFLLDPDSTDYPIAFNEADYPDPDEYPDHYEGYTGTALQKKQQLWRDTVWALTKAGAKQTGECLRTRQGAQDFLADLDQALHYCLNVTTSLGSEMMRMQISDSNILMNHENTTNAESTIRDADMAKAMTSYTKNQVLLQAAQSMLAQANQNSSSVLSLLQ